MANQPYRSIPFQWWSTFSSPNATDIQSVDSAWDGIAKDFGLVAVDHEWAEKRGAPPTMDLPSDPTKGIYVVEAYHTLHCLVFPNPSSEIAVESPYLTRTDENPGIVFSVHPQLVGHSPITPCRSLLRHSTSTYPVQCSRQPSIHFRKAQIWRRPDKTMPRLGLLAPVDGSPFDLQSNHS